MKRVPMWYRDRWQEERILLSLAGVRTWFFMGTVNGFITIADFPR